jgi:lysozyme family protein
VTDRERFERLIGFVLEHEGGYVNDPTDPGGETKYGISKRSYPRLDIKNLTIEDAKGIYYQDWWLPLKCPQIHDDKVAQKYLDTCVNTGKGTGTKILQRALQMIGYRITVDGAIGPKTLAAVNAADPQALLVAMRQQQKAHYEQLIQKNPKLEKFRRGWMARANS